MKGKLFLFLVAALLAAILFAAAPVAAQGGSQCEQDPNCEHLDNPGNTGSATAPGPIWSFVIKAGRDGLNSDCYLLFNPFNLKIHNDLINKSTSENTKILNTIKLQTMVHYAQAKTCRIAYLLKYFGEKAGPHCIQCDNCSAIYQTRHPLLVTVSDKQELAKIKFLIEKRAELAREHRLPPTEVITDSSLCYLAHCRPRTKAEYAKIPGIGTGWIEKWQHQFGRILVELDS